MDGRDSLRGSCWYPDHHRAAVDWILRSERPAGGSSAQYLPAVGWSRSYPETTGYIITTLIDADRRLEGVRYRAAAERFGAWLLSIQNADGSWNGGVHPTRAARPSVFNTGQILNGMLALWRATGDGRWIDAADRGARWLESGIGKDGLWPGGDYRSGGTPSYYSHALWPLLDVAMERGHHSIADAAIQGIRTIITRTRPNGAIGGWAFQDGAPAFTHTIAYTIRGIQECGLLLGDDAMLRSVEPALDRLVRIGELHGGSLPGAFDEDWRRNGRFVCLTGSVQVARCILLHEARCSDLRLVSAAARLVDNVCRRQSLDSVFPGIRGAVAGSTPLWGPYMRGRYPNWAAKFHCDAIVALHDRLEAIE